MTLEEICSEVRNFIDAPAEKPGAFDQLARKLFAFQYEHNAPYRAFCKSRNVSPKTLTSIDQISAIVTSAFKDLQLTVLPPHLRSTVFHSSGTTAQRPSRHFHSAETLRVYEQSLLRWFKPHVLPEHAKLGFLILAPPAPEAPNSSLVHMFETVASEDATSVVFAATTTPDGSWLLDLKMIRKHAEQLSRHDAPVVICGTAFSFVQLCDHLTEIDTTLNFPERSTVFETGGYKGRSRSVPKSELHEMISERLSIPETHIISEYGMSEISSQAYDQVIGTLGERIFQFPHWVRGTVVSPETGEEVSDGDIGLLRILDLANVGSVCAVQTEDLARRRGAGFELLSRAVATEPRGCSLMQVSS